jgi:hypothetical protein
MCCRSRPQYRSDLGWILGVAFLGTLTRSARPVRGFTFVRCCSSPTGFFPTRPRGVTRAWASLDGGPRVQLPLACGCYQLAPQRTFTSYPSAHAWHTKDKPFGRPEERAVLDCRCARRPHVRAGRDGRMAPPGAEQKNEPTQEDQMMLHQMP